MKVFKKLNVAVSQRITLNNLKISPIWYRFYGEEDYCLFKNKKIPLEWVYDNVVDNVRDRHFFYTFLDDNNFHKTQEGIIAASIIYGEINFNGYIYFIDREPTGIYILYNNRKTIFMSIVSDENDEANMEGFYIIKKLTGIEKMDIEFDIVNNIKYKLPIEKKIKVSCLKNGYKNFKYNYFKENNV
jgi:hypothetical protein